MADKDELARQAFLQQLSAQIQGPLKRMQPRPASKASPALDRAYAKLAQREPDAASMNLSELPWEDPQAGGEAYAFAHPPNAVEFDPADSAIASEDMLEQVLRHELEHVRQYGAGQTPSEPEAYGAESRYGRKRGFTPESLAVPLPWMDDAVLSEEALWNRQHFLNRMRELPDDENFEHPWSKPKKGKP